MTERVEPPNVPGGRWTRMALCCVTGFASGMPLYVLIQLLPAWLQDHELSVETITAASITTLPYTWKFLWAPLADRIGFERLGRRRSWMLVCQAVLAVLFLGLGTLDPSTELVWVLALCGGIGFFSASQDIALDAYRREILTDEELGLGNTLAVNLYRLSSLIPGSLALVLADRVSWAAAHASVAAAMVLCAVVTVLAPEPTATLQRPASLQEAVVEPFRAFVRRRGARGTAVLLAFMLLYKLGDSMAIGVSTLFYLDIGFSKIDVASTVKSASLGASIVGGFLGGGLMLRLGIHRSLWVFGIVQLLSILGFAWLAWLGPDVQALFAVVSFEYFGVGLGTAAFVSFIASLTDPRYTAAQLALLTSITGLPRTFATAGSGVLVDGLGWVGFFLLCTALAVPGLAMVPWVIRLDSSTES